MSHTADIASRTHMVDAVTLRDFTRFSAFGDAELFDRRPDGSVMFGKYINMFDGCGWDPEFPAILGVVPNSCSRIVEGHRRICAFAYLGRGEVPVVHSYTQEECAHFIRSIYNIEIGPPTQWRQVG